LNRSKASVLVRLLIKFAGYVRDTKTGHWVSGKSAGVGFTVVDAKALLSILGIKAVSHSSGAAILTAGSGYIGGTIGFGAAIMAFFSWF
jgi:hypothetical protein